MGGTRNRADLSSLASATNFSSCIHYVASFQSQVYLSIKASPASPEVTILKQARVGEDTLLSSAAGTDRSAKNLCEAD